MLCACWQVLLNATTRKDATGKIVGVVGVGQDITLMKAAQLVKARLDSAELESERQKAVSEAKDLFLASMSHEIRTPLSSLLGLLRIATDSLQGMKPPRVVSDTVSASAPPVLRSSEAVSSHDALDAPLRQLSMVSQAGDHLV